MTIIKTLSAPLWVVVGATGNQGGSVIKAIQASAKDYRVRALMRDISKPIARDLEAVGCETYAVDVTVPGDALNKAFAGGDIAFCLTLSEYGIENPGDVIFAKGKILMDAVKAAGISSVAWSGMPYIYKISGGKFKTEFFDGLAQGTEYGRSIGLTIHDICPPSFASNYIGMAAPRKQADGTFTMAAVYDKERLLPMSDIAEDYGKYAVSAVEHGVETVYAAPSYITATDICASLSKASGKIVNYKQLPSAVLRGIIAQQAGDFTAKHLMDMYDHFEGMGYYGGENGVVDLTESNKILSQRARTFDEFLAANKEVVDQVFA